MGEGEGTNECLPEEISFESKMSMTSAFQQSENLYPSQTALKLTLTSQLSVQHEK